MLPGGYPVPVPPMPTIEDDIRIEAPVEEVYEYLIVPENHVEILPSLMDIRNVDELDSGGFEGEYTFKMLGMELEGSFRDTEVITSERRVYELTGDIEAEVRYEFESVDGETRFTYFQDYEPLHSGLVGKITQPMADRYLKREVSNTLENTKMIIEETE